MLTSELLRYQIQNGQIFVIYVNPKSEKYLNIARDIIDIYVAYLGKTRGELTAALEEYEAYDPDYRVKRGLAKVLENKAKFEVKPACAASIAAGRPSSILFVVILKSPYLLT